MTHPPSDPAAEAEIALREALASALARREFVRRSPNATYAWEGIGSHWRGKFLSDADDLIAGPLAPLLADIAALRTRAEKERNTREQWVNQAHEFAFAADRYGREKDTVEADLLALARMYGEACGIAATERLNAREADATLRYCERQWASADGATLDKLVKARADRDRLATELAEARAALEFYAQDEVWRQHGECNPEHAWFTGPNTARRALTTAKGNADVEA